MKLPIACLKKIIQIGAVEKIWLYGSRARQDNNSRSDFDLAISCPDITEQEWQTILFYVEEADSLLPIDCVRLETVHNQELLKNITKDGRLLYSKKDTWMDKALYQDSLSRLSNAIDRFKDVLTQKDIESNEFLQDAAIQRFEFAIELYWKVLKKYLAYEKIESSSPRDVFKKAFQYTIIDDETVWLKMLEDRNNSLHVYSKQDAYAIFCNLKHYCAIMEKSYLHLQNLFNSSE